jgi:tetratricopeptide (TPR) repeat protein
MHPPNCRRSSAFRRAAAWVCSALLWSGYAWAADAGRSTDPAADPVPQVQAQAAARHRPWLAVFSATDCDGCRYLARHVQTGREWQDIRHRAEVIALDADLPAGDRYRRQWRVTRLPATIVFDAEGRELGRIIGVETRSAYFRQLHDRLSRTIPVDALRAHVVDARAASRIAARQALASGYRRDEAADTLQWWGQLSPALRDPLQRDRVIRGWLARLTLLKASQPPVPAECSAAAPAVFAADLGCDLPLELQRVMDCIADAPEAERRKLLEPEKVRLSQLIYARVFVSHPSCADGRDAVMTVTALDEQLGYPKAAAAMLDAAIADARHRLGGDLRSDRGLADDLRLYLDRSGRLDALEAFYPRLIAAFPDSPVPEYSLAQSLAARGRFAEALPHFERAATKAQGRYRLAIAQAWVQALIRLGQADQARAVVDDTLQAVGPWFPEPTERLRSLLINLGR